ncbi:MAG: carboxylesterase/lipase family protein [Phenylobacterium sp.]|uniref:carboxylesterase/lipase family protein n=1 Tax=Phenylobacterium sp. TaxID=1871053 RepID=UPI002725B99E|nr:carboxylesterase/lipase family protein [Phenylobacterium sp.]MDO8901979.1 carboxylesterase/lipase family protein [Phenylobacterium sp.]
MTKITLNRRWVLAGGLWLAAGPRLAHAAAPVVETAAGRLKGASSNGVLSFKGVPYGEPTGGTGRFMPPRPRQPWAGVREALDYGASAPQTLVEGVGAPRDPAAPAPYPSLIRSDIEPPPQSEDCLFLNVWTPSTTGKRPVMFWLHGGGFSTGSGSSAWYDGANLARKQDVVVVTINHRLNVFGFADLSAFGDRYASSASVGMADCVLALQWVKDNIERFGGDPDRVMIHGESGGGRKVSVLMAYQPAKGLFHRAVVQSGSQLRVDGPELAAEKGRRLLAELQIAPADVDRLAEVPFEDLRRAGMRASSGLGQWRPTVDGRLLPRHPFDPDAPDLTAGIPMMIGTNRTEMSIYLAVNPAMDSLSTAGLKAMIGRLTSADRAQEVLDLYQRLYPASTNAERLYMAATDRSYFLDSTLQAERKAAQDGAGAYYYAFYRETPVQDGRFFSPHAQEIPFVFDNLDKAEVMVGPVTPQAQLLADQMSGAWAAFARTGVPAAPGLPAWPLYDSSRPALVFDEGECRIENDIRSEQRQLMATFGSQQDVQSELPTPGEPRSDAPV